jgi:hypothetical protein
MYGVVPQGTCHPGVTRQKGGRVSGRSTTRMRRGGRIRRGRR